MSLLNVLYLEAYFTCCIFHSDCMTRRMHGQANVLSISVLTHQSGSCLQSCGFNNACVLEHDSPQYIDLTLNSVVTFCFQDYKKIFDMSEDSNSPKNLEICK